ncbi:hypothetical protein MTR67_028007 [Solanum verrucosum]|uniref:Uncharacterized protein n=1 Tax=Solanum verrucosum TaxID=315347 RepID=A0AAF0R678_SOLVR|nr:hypothetical protein MTR67_028007 [Solanum verrucosum]
MSLSLYMLRKNLIGYWLFVSLNNKSINVYDSYREAGHDRNHKFEVEKLAQLIPLKITMNDYYKNRGIDRKWVL